MTEETLQTPSRKQMWLRLSLLLFVLLGLYIIGSITGLNDYISLENLDKVRTFMLDAGPLGLVAYLALFAVCLLMQVPGMLMVALGVVAYGEWLGGPAALVGAILSVSFSFGVVRTIGGKPLSEPKHKLFRKIMSQLEEHPIRTVVILRFLFLLSPPLNYALALSGLRFRHFLIGSAIGLAIPIILLTPFIELILTWLRS